MGSLSSRKGCSRRQRRVVGAVFRHRRWDRGWLEPIFGHCQRGTWTIPAVCIVEKPLWSAVVECCDSDAPAKYGKRHVDITSTRMSRSSNEGKELSIELLCGKCERLGDTGSSHQVLAWSKSIFKGQASCGCPQHGGVTSNVDRVDQPRQSTPVYPVADQRDNSPWHPKPKCYQVGLVGQKSRRQTIQGVHPQRGMLLGLLKNVENRM